MAKLKNPLMSLKATGGLAKLFSLAKRQGRHILERKPIPTDAKSPAQLFNRHMFTKCVDLWHLLSSAEQQQWESLARPRHMSGYAWFVSQCLRPNPGIYLPLQGGKMSGDIDMDGNRIEDLPDPPAAQDPATKAYHDANKYTNAQADARIALHTAIAAAHHARYTNGEADARIALHAAIVAAHHARYADAEAITAAKTVKLDDFATPDDNADLNASAARHGLFKKLDGVATHFLNGLGNWAAVVSGPTVATGTYTGNGANNRQITTGFKCSMVIIMGRSVGSVPYRWVVIPNKTVYDNAISNNLIRTDALLHAADGFEVDANFANTNGSSYPYWAISE